MHRSQLDRVRGPLHRPRQGRLHLRERGYEPRRRVRHSFRMGSSFKSVAGRNGGWGGPRKYLRRRRLRAGKNRSNAGTDISERWPKLCHGLSCEASLTFEDFLVLFISTTTVFAATYIAVMIRGEGTSRRSSLSRGLRGSVSTPSKFESNNGANSTAFTLSQQVLIANSAGGNIVD